MNGRQSDQAEEAMDPQTIVCENCGRTIGRLEQPRRWQAHLVCFECHERLAHQAGGAAGSAPGAAALETGTAGAGADPGADDVRWRQSPSWIPYLPLYSLFGVLALVSLWLASVLSVYFLILFPIFAIMVAGWEIQRRSVRYTITAKRVVAERGIMNREHRELRVADIREATLDQTLIQRIVGLGTVKVDTAANAGVEIEMLSVPHPAHVLELLNELRG
jgi:membrane protein YdbS with pleckstrin-like domain